LGRHRTCLQHKSRGVCVCYLGLGLAAGLVQTLSEIVEFMLQTDALLFNLETSPSTVDVHTRGK